MEKILRVFLLNILLMLGFMANAFAGYTGPELKLPLPFGYSWGVNTIPNSYETHMFANYYSIDFDDDIEEDQVGDFGENVVDVLAAASGNATVHANYGGYGNAVIIDHGNGYSTIYGHLYSFAITGGLVSQGQVLGKLGTTGRSDGPHVHFQIMYNGDSSSDRSELEGVSVEGVRFTDHNVGGYYYSTNRVISTAVSSAISSKANELWAIRPSGSGVSCEDRSPSGLICHEVENMHWWEELSDPYVIETWNEGTQGQVDLVFDPDNTDQDRAYVVWGGFREMFHVDGHPDEYGPPIGDELDSTFGEYRGYDPYCDQEIGDNNGQVDSWERDQCLELFCGSSRTYTSVQRFKDVTLCWNSETWEAECDPKWPNEHCREASGLTTGGASVYEGDLFDLSGTVYWYDGRSLRGVVSADVFNACGFDWGEIQEGTQADLDPLGWGEMVDDPVDCGVLKHGDVFTTDQTTTVYQYVNGLKRPITSGEVFTACGFDWGEIQTFPASSITSIQDGSVINTSSVCYLTPDLVWREMATGNMAAWYMDGTSISSGASVGTSDMGWSLVGSGDFTRDGSVDLLWRHNSSPYEVYLWEMDGSTVSSTILIAGSTDPDWVIRGVSDFTSDGEPDILWKDQATGELSLWVVSQEEVVASVDISSASDTSWDIRATGDLTGDGKSDILWRNPTTGALSLWQMDGTSYVSSISLTSSSNTSWDVEAIGDFTSDGINDILWRNPTTGELSVWEMDGTSYVSSISLDNSDPSWDLVAVGEVDGN